MVNEETDGSIGAGFRDATASTLLDIRPQINLDGLIRMDLTLNVDEFTDPDGNQKNLKELKTNVTIANGQVLVLGGFVKTKVTESKAKTPLLGDIPVLGWLFKRQSRTISKSYVFIFLSPTIIKPRSTPGMQLYTKMKMHDATDQIEESVQTKRTVDPIHNWFFNPEQESYSHKVIDFANARYQPTTVDMQHDKYYGITPEEDDVLAPIGERSQLDDDVTFEAEPAMLAQAEPLPTLDEPPSIKPKKVPKKELAVEKTPVVEAIPPANDQFMIEKIPVAQKVQKKKQVAGKNKSLKQSTQLNDYGKDINQKREKLKEMLGASSSNKKNKRQKLQEVVTPPGTSTTPALQQGIAAKREQLKQLLAASPIHAPRRRVTV